MTIAKAKMDNKVVMFRMDYEIIKRVYEYANVVGLSDEEISFLMGKRNSYFFGLLDPTEKEKLKTEQLDILPTILGLRIKDLVPNDILPGENVTIHASKKVSEKKIVYRHYVIFSDGRASDVVTWNKKIIRGKRRVVNVSVHEHVLRLFESEYWDVPHSALDLYLTLRTHGQLLSPADLQKSLAVLLNKRRKGPVGLYCEINNARYFYYRK